MWRGLFLLRIPTLARKARLFLEWNWAMCFPPDIAHFGYRRTQRRTHPGAIASVVVKRGDNRACVFLLHLQVDDVGELPGLFRAGAVSSGDPIIYKIWGPAGSDPKTQ